MYKLCELIDKIRERRAYPCNDHASSSSISKEEQQGFIDILREIVDELNQQDILPDYFLKLISSQRYNNVYNNKRTK